MATLAAYPGMMRRSRQRLGTRECRGAWLVGITVRENRRLEAGQGDPLFVLRVSERMVEVSPVSHKQLCGLPVGPQLGDTGRTGRSSLGARYGWFMSLAAYPHMRAATEDGSGSASASQRLLGVTVREYRQLEGEEGSSSGEDDTHRACMRADG
jgi:hypothetical protein